MGDVTSLLTEVFEKNISTKRYASENDLGLRECLQQVIQSEIDIGCLARVIKPARTVELTTAGSKDENCSSPPAPLCFAEKRLYVMRVNRSFEAVQEHQDWSSRARVEVVNIEEIAVWRVESLGASWFEQASREYFSPDRLQMGISHPPRWRVLNHVRQFRRFTFQPKMEVQVFGVKKSADTRKALRFFAERRIKTHFVDLNERAASLGELRRFAQKFGVAALIDQTSARYQDLGLMHARMSDETWLTKLSEEPLILKMPVVRQGMNFTIGLAEATWKEWTGR